VKRQLRVVEDGDGFRIVDQADGATVDWVAKPVHHATPPGPEVTYVIIEEKPEAWTDDMRWIITKGQRVEQTSGLNQGRRGTNVGQGRSRRANRVFARNLAAAASIPGRELGDDDFECLIDNEGPLVVWDGETEPDWMPGQAACIRPI